MTDITKNASLSIKIMQTRRSTTLKVNGKQKGIVQDALHQRLLDLAALANPEEGIRQGMEDIAEGRIRSAREVFEEMRKNTAYRTNLPLSQSPSNAKLAPKENSMQRWLKATTFVAAVLTTSLLISQVEKKLAQTERFPQFDNADVKVWKTIIQPNQPLSMHRHDHPRVIIALTGGTVNIVSPNGAIEPHVWETGKAYWLPAMPPNTLHSDANAGTKPIEVMVVELQKEN